MSNNQVETELDNAVQLEKELTISSGITDAESESISKQIEITRKLNFMKSYVKRWVKHLT